MGSAGLRWDVNESELARLCSDIYSFDGDGRVQRRCSMVGEARRGFGATSNQSKRTACFGGRVMAA